MADMLGNALAKLAQWRHERMTRTVIWARGTGQTELSATVGRTPLTRASASGVTVEASVTDYIVRAADLADAGLGDPIEGDQILDTIAGTVHVFEAMRMEGERCWRWCDATHLDVRVHVKFIGTEGS